MSEHVIEAMRSADGRASDQPPIVTIDAEEAAELRARQDRNATWSAQFIKPNGWTVIDAAEQATCPADARITNEERGRLDQFETRRDKPERLFAYVKRLPDSRIAVTTWMGDVLGYGTHGRTYRSNFGDARTPIWFRIDGADYTGTHYTGAGDYCRARRSKKKG
jgi:hypothetical protein